MELSETSLRKFIQDNLLREMYDKSWEKFESVLEALGAEHLLAELARSLTDEALDNALDDIIRNNDIILADKENRGNPNIDQDPFMRKNIDGDDAMFGLNEDVEEGSKIIGKDILNHFPFNELPQTREGVDFHKGIEGWGKIQVPSLPSSDSMTTMFSVDDVLEYLDDFVKYESEEPIFELNPEGAWFDKIKIVNDTFTEKRKRYSDAKGKALQNYSSLDEIKQLVNQVLSEEVWTSADWDHHIGRQSAGNDSKKEDILYEKLLSYITNDYDKHSVVDDVMKLAGEAYPGTSGYDLIDLVKYSLSQVEKSDDTILGNIRKRADKAYKEVDDHYLMVNENDISEIEIIDEPDPNFDYADAEREFYDRGYLEDELRQAEEESSGHENSSEEELDERFPKEAGDPYTITLPSGIISSM